MLVPARCSSIYACWDTAKTKTHELVVIGPHGILSIKVVEGRQSKVYTGFDPATWDSWPTTSLDAWEHKYVEAQEKNAKKYGSSTDAGAMPGSLMALIEDRQGAFYEAVSVAIIEDEKVRDHCQMFNGIIPGVSSMRGASKAAVAPKTVPSLMKEIEERRQLQHADEEWGRF